MKIKRNILEDGIRKSGLTLDTFADRAGVCKSTIARAKRGCNVG